MTEYISLDLSMNTRDIDMFEADTIPRAVSALGFEGVVNEQFEHPPHRHPKAHLILSLRGLITCEVAKGLWMVPGQCALWIPGGMEHSVRCSGGEVAACLLFIDPKVTPALPTECNTVSVGPLLRELMVEAARLPVLYDPEGPDGRLIQTMLDQLARAPVESLHLPMPTDPRLRRIANSLTTEPANDMKTGDWARAVAMSERSFLRLLTKQTGMSFGRWRQQFQVMFAIERLTQGMPVQAVAFDLGYESASAFITMFKKIMGQPPGQYVAARQTNGVRGHRGDPVHSAAAL